MLSVKPRLLAGAPSRARALQPTCRVRELASLGADYNQRAMLLAVSNASLADEATIRPVIAARLLVLSKKAEGRVLRPMPPEDAGSC
jgi:hypothetical protein